MEDDAQDEFALEDEFTLENVWLELIAPYGKWYANNMGTSGMWLTYVFSQGSTADSRIWHHMDDPYHWRTKSGAVFLAGQLPEEFLKFKTLLRLGAFDDRPLR